MFLYVLLVIIVYSILPVRPAPSETPSAVPAPDMGVDDFVCRPPPFENPKPRDEVVKFENHQMASFDLLNQVLSFNLFVNTDQLATDDFLNNNTDNSEEEVMFTRAILHKIRITQDWHFSGFALYANATNTTHPNDIIYDLFLFDMDNDFSDDVFPSPAADVLLAAPFDKYGLYGKFNEYAETLYIKGLAAGVHFSFNGTTKNVTKFPRSFFAVFDEIITGVDRRDYDYGDHDADFTASAGPINFPSDKLAPLSIIYYKDLIDNNIRGFNFSNSSHTRHVLSIPLVDNQLQIGDTYNDDGMDTLPTIYTFSHIYSSKVDSFFEYDAYFGLFGFEIFGCNTSDICPRTATHYLENDGIVDTFNQEIITTFDGQIPLHISINTSFSVNISMFDMYTDPSSLVEPLPAGIIPFSILNIKDNGVNASFQFTTTILQTNRLEMLDFFNHFSENDQISIRERANVTSDLDLGMFLNMRLSPRKFRLFGYYSGIEYKAVFDSENNVTYYPSFPVFGFVSEMQDHAFQNLRVNLGDGSIEFDEFGSRKKSADNNNDNRFYNRIDNLRANSMFAQFNSVDNNNNNNNERGASRRFIPVVTNPLFQETFVQSALTNSTHKPKQDELIKYDNTLDSSTLKFRRGEPKKRSGGGGPLPTAILYWSGIMPIEVVSPSVASYSTSIFDARVKPCWTFFIDRLHDGSTDDSDFTESSEPSQSSSITATNQNKPDEELSAAAQIGVLIGITAFLTLCVFVVIFLCR